MKYKVILTPNFEKDAWQLVKKYPNIIDDFIALKKQLKKDPLAGADPYGQDCYKLRMAITDKGQGKSGSARVMYHVKVLDGKVYMLSVFDKSEQDTFRADRLTKFLRKLGFIK